MCIQTGLGIKFSLFYQRKCPTNPAGFAKPVQSQLTVFLRLLHVLRLFERYHIVDQLNFTIRKCLDRLGCRCDHITLAVMYSDK